MREATSYELAGGQVVQPSGCLRLPLADAPSDAALCIHRAGVIVYVSDALLRLLGRSSALDVIGQRIDSLVEPCHRADVRRLAGAAAVATMAARLADERGVMQLEFRVRNADATGHLGLVMMRPFHEEAASRREGEGHMNVRDRRFESGATVLICDDEARLASLTAGLLEDYGYEPLTVARGDEALGALSDSARRIDLVLLDVNLTSGLSARGLLLAMLERNIDVRVVLTSGLAEEDVPEDLLAHTRVAGYLAKPYSVEQLVEAIDRALAGRPGPNSRE